MVRQHLTLTTWVLILIIALLALRLFTMAILPVFDTTEARYAEIARIMFETNNWVTPQFDYNIPFWGKPPFHTWLSATSFVMFGVSELSARLPHFICGVAVGLLVYNFCRQTVGHKSALLGVLVLTSSVGFIVSMGMVMTDTALLLSITLCMLSYYKAYQYGDRDFHGHLFFVGLALGMLVKGPVAIVLVGIALICWCAIHRNVRQALSALPWVTGVGLFITLTLPWYVLAEIRTPGFLEYFLIGEHINRFLVSGWEGDLYGTAHNKPRGTIWLYWLVAAFPWSFALIGKATSHVLNRGKLRQNTTSLSSYLVCFMIAPMLLFTLSGNILSAYVLPGFSALAVLVALHFKLTLRLVLAASLTLVILLTATTIIMTDNMRKTSEIALLGESQKLYKLAPLFYWHHRPFSARFYSHGAAQLITESGDLHSLTTRYTRFYLAYSHEQHNHVVSALKNLNCLEKNRTNNRVLLLCETKD